MASSGTVAQTIVDIATIVDHAFRRAGVSPAEQTQDSINAALDCLYFYLSQLATKETNLWTVEKIITGSVIGQDSYPIIGSLGGVVDIRNALYRKTNLASGGTATSSAGGTAANAFDGTLTSNACTQVSASGSISYNFGSGNPTGITNVGIMTNGNQTYTPVFEYSMDGSTWSPVLTLAQTTFTGSQWYYYDIASPVAAQYFRIRETGNGILNVIQLGFNTILNEIQMARLNQDQYANLTNKTFQGTNLLQYWLDRQIPNPIARIWPVSNYSFDQMVFWARRYIQDVGKNLSGTIEVPQYWIEAIITETAKRLILELPKADVKRYQMLSDAADQATMAAQQEDRDKSPIQLMPNISCYTV